MAEGQVVSCHGRARDPRSSRRPPVKPEIHGRVGDDGKGTGRRSGRKKPLKARPTEADNEYATGYSALSKS